MKNGIHVKTAAVLLSVAVIGLASFFVACYPGDSVTVSDTDVVATFYDKGTDFATKLTYFMPDSVFEIVENDVRVLTGTSATTILNRIKANMTSSGFTPADRGSADVHLAAAVTTTTWKGGGCYPGYWGGYWGYPPGWGWCYPVDYTYTTGTLLIVMANRDQANENNAIWLAGINGLLKSSTTDIPRINTNIDKAFSQSPYLKAGK